MKQNETWKEFEKLANDIYTKLTPQGAIVTHNDHILGKESGTERQIDVSIRYALAGHTILTIIQAKDYSEPADVNIVGEFESVINDVNANKGILICRSGFTNTAKTYAINKGIDLCNIYDTSTKKWTKEISIPILWIDRHPILAINGNVFLNEGEQIETSIENMVFSIDFGKTRILLLKTFERLWNSQQIPQSIGIEHNLLSSEKLFLRINSADKKVVWREFEDFVITYNVIENMYLGSFSPEQCKGILNYIDGKFRGYFPIGEIPIKRDESWEKIESKDTLQARYLGTVITSEGYTISTEKIMDRETLIQHLESGNSYTF